MSEEYTDEERELINKARAEKAKRSRKVTVKGTHKESGAEYSFDLDGDDADRVINRHRSLFEEETAETKAAAAKTEAKSSNSSHPYFSGNKKE